MKFALSVIAFILAALIIPFFIPGSGVQQGVDPNSNLPWQIQLDGQGGSQVFGLQPGVSTLAEVRGRLGAEPEVAIVAAPNEDGAVEAYYSQVALGFVLAKVVLTVDVPAAEISAMRARASKAQFMESTTVKIRLQADDLARVDQAPVKALSVIPTVNLDEATIIQRFGQAAERLVVSDKQVHLLYPAHGLDIILDGAGKELLQYVAPRDFPALVAPLHQALAAEGKPQ
ncbi:MAG: hypothetical protein PHT48_02485 [Dechloromonas sp.]|nr:hypothetical protein [Dechloromonas sp.]